MKFHVFGLDNAPNRVLALHGFMANGQAWESFADYLGADWQVIAPDIAPRTLDEAHFDAICDDIAQRLYGLSPWVEEEDPYWRETYCETYNWPAPPILLGYSMGGRIALELLWRYPDVPISALVLESAGLGVDDDVERDDYFLRAQTWAQRFRTQSPQEYVSWWESLPLFETQRSLPAQVRERQRAMRLSISPEVLANLTVGIGVEHMHSAEENRALLRSLRSGGLPVTYVAGEQDTKYSVIARALDLEGICPVRIFDAGHNVHLEAPAPLAVLLRDLV